MKKKLSRLLMRLAVWLYPSITLENAEKARPIGLSVHIAKKDIRNFRKDHPEIKSHREGMKVLIEEAKWRIAGAIARGMVQHKAVDFTTTKTLYVADVSGVAFVYGGEKEGKDGE